MSKNIRTTASQFDSSPLFGITATVRLDKRATVTLYHNALSIKSRRKQELFFWGGGDFTSSVPDLGICPSWNRQPSLPHEMIPCNYYFYCFWLLFTGQLFRSHSKLGSNHCSIKLWKLLRQIFLQARCRAQPTWITLLISLIRPSF